MRILFLCQIIPYPPDAGPKVKTWHVLRYLAEQGHEITLVSFSRPGEEQSLPEVQKICKQVYTVPIKRSRAADVAYLLRSQISGRPFLIERDDLTEMRTLVNQLIASGQFDVVHVDQLPMAQFALAAINNASGSPTDRPYLVFDAHNAVWTILERMRENGSRLLGPVMALEGQRIKRYEGQLVRKFDRTLAVTALDREALLEAAALGGENSHAAEKISVIPIAVDTNLLRPVVRKPASTNLMTLGTLQYPPNADGIRWFTREVFPLIRQCVPEVTLTIVGKNPPADFIKLAERSAGAVTVTGYVPDLTPLLEQSALMVIPVRSGGGMRVRILEAFARAIPVVTTTVGLEGIDAQPGRDVIVADSPEDFSSAVVRLLDDPNLQAQLAANSRQFVESTYDWQVVLKKLSAVYGAI